MVAGLPNPGSCNSESSETDARSWLQDGDRHAQADLGVTRPQGVGGSDGSGTSNKIEHMGTASSALLVVCQQLTGQAWGRKHGGLAKAERRNRIEGDFPFSPPNKGLPSK